MKGRCCVMAKLTDKQSKFVEEYLIDLNATQAAIRAGYSVKNADKIGSELLGKTRVSNAISEQMAVRSRRTGINADRVVRELAKIAFVNASDVICTHDASVLIGATRDDTAAIASIKVKTIPTDDGTITEREVKFYSKDKALELLGKHLGMFTDKFKVEGAIPVVISDDLDEDDEPPVLDNSSG